MGQQEGVSIGEDNLVTCGPSRVRHNKIGYPPGTKQAKQEHAISNPQQYLQPVWISLPEIPATEKKSDGCGRTGEETSQIPGAAACPDFGSRRGCSNGRAEPSREATETQQPEIARLRRLSQMHGGRSASFYRVLDFPIASFSRLAVHSSVEKRPGPISISRGSILKTET